LAAEISAAFGARDASLAAGPDESWQAVTASAATANVAHLFIFALSTGGAMVPEKIRRTR
jgi:hypothetical protein